MTSRSLTKLTPLQLYLREIAKYPLLEPHEELELARKHYEHGDIIAAQRLVTSNLRLVVKISNDFKQEQSNLLDLVQEGNYGLMQAVKRFNPYKGVKLSTYAAWWIRAYILKYIMQNHSQVKIGTTRGQRRLFYNLQREAEQLLREYEAVSPRMLADRLEVKEREVIEMQQRLDGNDLSFDALATADEQGGNTQLLNSLARANLEDEIISAQLQSRFHKELEEFKTTLDARDLDILATRILKDSPLTLQEIGDKYSISRERARQLEARLIKKLREFIAARGKLELPNQPQQR
ncbi:MAG: RNA polymerase factor sigma-32 [Pseudomonadota bacterium]|nr:RNA polymerase factor sigma-32 [Pseudomonadota bacterium]